MNRTKVVSQGVWEVPETTELDALTICEGASIVAPEGKSLTMTVDGVGTWIRSGVFEGKVVLSVTDKYTQSMERHGNVQYYDFRTGVHVEDGKYRPEYSVPAIVQGGSVSDTEAKGMTIVGREDDFNGFYIAGDTEYTISDVKIDLEGDGSNDFIGFGAGIAATGNAKLTINNADIRTNGVTRGCVFVGGHSVVTVNDSRLFCTSRMVPHDEYQTRIKQGRMMAPPWVMGFRGSCRTTNLADYGTVYYNNCWIGADNWGTMCIDGADIVRMYLKDCTLEITGPSGYGTLVIGDSQDVFDHCRIKNVTFAAIMSNDTNGAEYKNGCVVDGVYGAQIFRNYHGQLKINSGSVFNTKRSTIVCKGSTSYITVDAAVLNPDNGIVLQVMDNDETGMGGGDFIIPTERDTRVEGRDVTNVGDEDVYASFSNMEVNGDIINTSTNLYPNCVKAAPGPGGLGGPGGPGGPGAGSPPQRELGPGETGRGSGDDLQGAKSLEVRFANAKVNGLVTAATAHYKEGLTVITEQIREELSNITFTPSPVCNNGVIVYLDEKSVWNVPGDCWLSRLSLAEGAVLQCAEGKSLTMTVDGVETPIAAGEYSGEIALIVK